MDRKISSSRKLSMDMHRKLSAISTCSDVSNLSYKLGMEPDDFKCTIKNILGKYLNDKIKNIDILVLKNISKVSKRITKIYFSIHFQIWMLARRGH